MLSEKKLKQLSEARKHIQHKPLSEETKQKISKANNGNFFGKCDYCGKEYHTKKSHYEKRKRHFCCKECYFKFVKEILPFDEQNSYKGVRSQGESKQVYHRNYCKNHPETISHLKANRYTREKVRLAVIVCKNGRN